MSVEGSRGLLDGARLDVCSGSPGNLWSTREPLLQPTLVCMPHSIPGAGQAKRGQPWLVRGWGRTKERKPPLLSCALIWRSPSGLISCDLGREAGSALVPAGVGDHPGRPGGQHRGRSHLTAAHFVPWEPYRVAVRCFLEGLFTTPFSSRVPQTLGAS